MTTLQEILEELYDAAELQHIAAAEPVEIADYPVYVQGAFPVALAED